MKDMIYKPKELDKLANTISSKLKDKKERGFFRFFKKLFKKDGEKNFKIEFKD